METTLKMVTVFIHYPLICRAVAKNWLLSWSFNLRLEYIHTICKQFVFMMYMWVCVRVGHEDHENKIQNSICIRRFEKKVMETIYVIGINGKYVLENDEFNGWKCLKKPNTGCTGKKAYLSLLLFPSRNDIAASKKAWVSRH